MTKLLFTGDIATDRALLEPSGGVLSASSKFNADIENLFNLHSFKIGNLEGSFSDAKNRTLKAGPNILLDYATFRNFSGFFDVLSGANNHSMDYGEEGFRTTIRKLTECNIKYVGVGENNNEAFVPFESEKFVIFCVSENEFGASEKSKCGIATFDDLYILYSQIKKFAGKKIVILYTHAGAEIIPIPPPYLRNFYKMLIDFGCNIIINNHPHVVQGYETYNEGYIFYSLGNFMWDVNRFKGYQNSDWSLLVSCNITDDNKFSLSTFYSNISGNEICLSKYKKYEEEMNFLCSLLASDDYETLYNSIVSNILHQVWYSKFFAKRSPSDTAELLHYIRCSAHRNNIERALSIAIGEQTINTLKNHKLIYRNHDYFSIERI